MQVGFLGLGTMGLAMATNLLKKDGSVLGWNRSPEPLDEFQKLGGSVTTAAADSLALPISFSMLASDAVCDQVLAPENLTPGTIHVGMASISPEMADRLTERFAAVGATYISAPVMGRPAVARAGELNILAGGNAAAIEQVEQYLNKMGTKVWRVAETPRTANLIKIAVNYNILSAIQTIGESVALVKSHGVKPEDFIELITTTMFDSVVYRGYGAQIAKRDHSEVLFSVELGKKDLALAIAAAAETGLVLPTASAIMEQMDRALADPELSNKDWAALAEVTIRSNELDS